eukprot:JP446313.1.p1 GENE.JP446313.1~~JP446313.1.p1  ORF type:complete len:206 (+),score=47.48 JP446313.1:536-1153(+)
MKVTCVPALTSAQNSVAHRDAHEYMKQSLPEECYDGLCALVFALTDRSFEQLMGSLCTLGLTATQEDIDCFMDTFLKSTRSTIVVPAQTVHASAASGNAVYPCAQSILAHLKLALAGSSCEGTSKIYHMLAQVDPTVVQPKPPASTEQLTTPSRMRKSSVVNLDELGSVTDLDLDDATPADSLDALDAVTDVDWDGAISAGKGAC